MFQPVELLFLTRSLNYGGSQRQLVELLKGLSSRKISSAVVTLYAGGPFQAELERAGVPIYSLNKKTRWDVVRSVPRLLKLVRQVQPRVLHGYLGTANILTILVKGFCPWVKVVWGVRSSNMELSRYGWLDQLLYWLEGRLSRFSDLIIVNSKSGLDYVMRSGFRQRKMVVVHNGINTKRFRPNDEAGRDFRLKHGIGRTETLIGLVGRLDPMKGHETFLRAASLLVTDGENVRFVCVGDGQKAYKEILRQLTESLGIAKSTIWLDEYAPIENLYNALDVLTSSSSYGEGFPNVIGEAMACGIPCVVTDVGDSKDIVGETGLVVPPNDVEALVTAWRRLMHAENSLKATKGKAARERIVQHFGLERLIANFINVLKPLGQHT